MCQAALPACMPTRHVPCVRVLPVTAGGNAKTSIVACVSPSEDSAQETHSTLVFAAGAKRIKNRVGSCCAGRQLARGVSSRHR